MRNIRLIYVTTPDLKTARRIGRELVEDRLAACANVLPRMESVYRWKGRVETARECVLLLKTPARRVPQVLARIRTLHPYECPCAVVLPITAGLPDFLKWVAEATTAGS